MKNILFTHFLVAILFCNIHELHSQSNEADSIRQLINSSSEENELKVDRLNELADAIKKTNTEEMKTLLDEARFLAQKLNYSEGLADYYIKKSLYYFNTKEFEKGIVLTDSAIGLCKKENLNLTLTSAYYYKGRTYSFHEKEKESIEYFNLALKNDSLYPGDNSILSKIYQSKGYALFFIGETDEAKKTFKKLIKTADLTDDYKKMANAYYMIAKIYAENMRTDKYNSYMDTAIFYSEKVDYPHMTVTLLNEKARQFAHKQKYTEALDYFLKALEESKKIKGYHNWESMLNGAIGHIHVIFENYDEAKSHFETGLKSAIEGKTNKGIIYHTRSLGQICEETGDFEKAMIHYKNAIKIAKDNNAFIELPFTYQRIANVKIIQGQYKEAVYFCDSALYYASEHNQPLMYNRILITIAQAKFNLNDVETALDYLDKYYKYSLPDNLRRNLRDANELYSGIYKKKNNYKKAYEHYVRFKELSDSVVNEKKVRELAFLESQYEFDKEKEAIQSEQEKKDALQEAELNKQKVIRNATLGGLLLVLILAFVILRSFIQKRKDNKILAKQKEEILTQSEELQTINDRLVELDDFKQGMTSMIVHDLKNPLNGIINIAQNLTPEDKISRMQQTGKQILNMVMNILDVHKYEESIFTIDKVPLDLSEIIDQALANTKFLIEQKSVQVISEIQGKFNISGDKEILERILVNILTNAIKFSPIDGKIWLIVDNKNESEIKVQVKDEGKGISQNEQATIFDKFAQAEARKSGKVRSTGLGLTFSKMAVEAHGGAIGVTSNPEKGEIGTTLWFTLPLQEVTSTEKTLETKTKDKSIELSLTNDDKAYLKPFIEKLNQLLVYETTEINSILDQVEPNRNSNIIAWKKQMDECLYTMNEEQYKKLISLASL